MLKKKMVFFFHLLFLLSFGVSGEGQDSIVSVKSGDLSEVAISILKAETWLKTHVLAHYPSTPITAIVVGGVGGVLLLLCRKEQEHTLTPILSVQQLKAQVTAQVSLSLSLERSPQLCSDSKSDKDGAEQHLHHRTHLPSCRRRRGPGSVRRAHCISISSTIDSPNRSDVGATEHEHGAKVSVEGDICNPDSTENVDLKPKICREPVQQAVLDRKCSGSVVQKAVQGSEAVQGALKQCKAAAAGDPFLCDGRQCNWCAVAVLVGSATGVQWLCSAAVLHGCA